MKISDSNKNKLKSILQPLGPQKSTNIAPIKIQAATGQDAFVKGQVIASCLRFTISPPSEFPDR